MRVGIVGAEAAKFTPTGRAGAIERIREVLLAGADVMVSGGCHLGGIDIWAEEVAAELGIEPLIFRPATRRWSDGYKPRNLLIAQHSDVLHNIVVDTYPPDFRGMRFPLCYHCNTTDHVKSGGCWTMKEAARLDRTWRQHVIANGVAAPVG